VALTSAMKSAVTAGTPGEDIDRRYGGFNDFPPGWREIDADEFWGKFGTYGPGSRAEYRQMGKRGGEWILGGVGQGPLLSAHLFFYGDGSGLAAEVRGEYFTRGGESGYRYTPRFYRFALCEHEYEVTVRRMCYRESTCKLCGHVDVVDSSG
jgi:hypothetical protein